MSLEALMLHGIYEAVPTRIAGQWCDEHENPWVDIMVANQPLYYGVVTPSRQAEEKKKVSDSLRDIVRFQPESVDNITVMVVTIDNSAPPEGPYEVIATNDMLRQRAEEVVMSENVFYGSYMFDSTKKAEPILRVYAPSSEKEGNAIMVPIDIGRARSDLARLREEQAYTPRLRELFPGDRFLVRQITHPKPDLYFCNRLFCFLEKDNAFAPDGTQLVTKATGFTKGYEIQDLVMVSANGDTGIGYVPVPGRGPPYYMEVRVADAADSFGKYLRRVEITENKGGFIDAKRAA
jgi:hypothetical protein